MWFKFVIVVILLAIASSGNARPRDPDPLDGSNSQEVTEETVGAVNRSRYIMKRQVPLDSLTSNPRHIISITSSKYGNSSNASNRMAHSVLSNLSINIERKNYVPLGALSYGIAQTNNSLKLIKKSNRQWTDTNSNKFNPLTIAFTHPLQTPMLLPRSVSLLQKNEIIITNSTFPNEQKLLIIPSPKSISFSSKPIDVLHLNSVIRDKRMISRNFVRIIPQHLTSAYIHRNSTMYKIKPYDLNVQLKNWPNEALKNIQDLLNYDKYTSSANEVFQVPVVKFNISSEQEPAIKSPELQYLLNWSKIPTLDTLSPSNERIDSMIRIDSLLDDLRKNNVNSQNYGDISDIKQNTVFHFLNLYSQKPNVTLTSPIHIKNVNRTKIGNNRPPQNVHIMFMVDKNDPLRNNQTKGQYMPDKEILGADTNCPTILINSITQINNTIESKEGCTDLNIIINSHILNTNIFKPVINDSINFRDVVNSSGIFANSYKNNISSNNYYNNYNTDYKDSLNQIQTDKFNSAEFVQSEHEIPTFHLFQGTHINIGETDETAQDIEDNENSFGSFGSNEFMKNNTDGLSASNGVGNNSEDTSINSDSQVSQFSETAPIIDDIETGQANGAIGEISLPSLSNLPTRPGQITNGISNFGSGGNAGILDSNGETNILFTDNNDDNDDDDELFDALSPVGLLESISSVFTYFSVLNPVNYGIFGIAVAPFIAFAAGILGVAAFLFPWVFPSNLNFSRTWNNNSSGINIKIHKNLQDIVQSSINKYTHLNEWKGRRRKKKKKK